MAIKSKGRPARNAVTPGPDQAEAYRLAVENMRDGIALFDADDRLVLANARYCAMYGLEPDKIRPGTAFADILAASMAAGRLAADTVHSSRDARDRIRTAGGTGVFRLRTPSGRTYEVHERALAGGGFVSTHDDVTDRLQAEARVAWLARHDMLTGLLDLGAFRAALDERLAAHRPGLDAPFAVVRLDIVGFRLINEAYGQAGGDDVLTMLARRAVAAAPDFTFARVGGDEFAALAPAADGPDALALRIDTLRRDLSRPYRLGPVDLPVAVGAGFALAPEHGDDATTLMRRADAARRQAVASGGERPGIFDWDMERERELRMRLAHDILPGIDRQEFVLVYQPIVDVGSGRLRGAEALLRWIHPEIGPVAPDLAVSVAEEYGRIGELGEWALRAAAAAATRWPKDLSVSVNVSGLQLRSRGFTRMIRSVLKDTGLEPNRLLLEVTESTVLSDRGARAVLERIADLGIRLALDDFGTGFSSLQYLLRYPFHRIKIDRSFVADMTGRTDSRAIVEAIIGLALRLGKDVVVEGIEREEEARLIAAWGPVNGQGYLYAPGLADIDFRAFALTRRVDPAA